MKQIKDILKKILEQVNEFRDDYVTNEQAVRTQLIEPILDELGWETSNPKFVRPNAPDEDGKIPDYTLLKEDKKTLIVEAKNLSIELQNKNIIDQLANYCFKSGIDFGVLTNGVKWLLFKTFEKNPENRIIWEVDLEQDKIDYVAKSLSSLAYSNIDILDNLLKKNKILADNWELLFKSTNSIVTIISQKLLEKIKSTEPTFKIEDSDLKDFTKDKIEEIFETSKNEEERDEEKVSIEKETKFEEVERLIYKKHKRKKVREKVSVKFPNGLVINHKIVADTFVETIKRIGPEKIIPLNIYSRGIAIVSDIEDDFYNQQKIGKYWIMVHTGTKEKIDILNEINERLDLKLTIEKFTNGR
jgi:predicted type IV restriction endonuclease